MALNSVMRSAITGAKTEDVNGLWRLLVDIETEKRTRAGLRNEAHQEDADDIQILLPC